MEQRLFQLIQRGELALVDGFEALGFGRMTVEFVNDIALAHEEELEY